jgi:CspA family cold shock protein
MTGTVRWFEPSRGFGFIRPDDRTADVFVHYGCMAVGEVSLADDDAVMAALEPGEKVEFEIVGAPCGRQARQVKRVDAQP